MSFAADITKGFFSEYQDKEALRLFIREKMLILSIEERQILEMKYCDQLPYKCIAVKVGKSERWLKTLHARIIEKSSGFVYAAVLKAIATSL